MTPDRRGAASMSYRLSRRHHVAVLTCILALTPIGVALAYFSGVSFPFPGTQTARADPATDGNGGAILGAGLPQYGDKRGFDIRLPETTGRMADLSTDAIPLPKSSFNSLAALDAVGATTGSKNWGASWSPDSGGSGAALLKT